MQPIQPFVQSNNQSKKTSPPTFEYQVKEFKNDKEIPHVELMPNYDELIKIIKELPSIQKSDPNKYKKIERCIEICLQTTTYFNDKVSNDKRRHVIQHLKDFYDKLQNPDKLKTVKGYFDRKHDYFFEPRREAVKITDEELHPSEFLCDLLTNVSDLAYQRKILGLVDIASSVLDENCIIVNSNDYSLCNNRDEAAKTYDGVTSFDDVTVSNSPLILVHDDRNGNHLLIEFSELESIIKANPIHPMTRCPLKDCNYQVVQSMDDSKHLFFGKDIAFNELTASDFNTISAAIQQELDNAKEELKLSGLDPVKRLIEMHPTLLDYATPSAPPIPKEEPIIGPTNEETAIRWLFDLESPLKSQFSTKNVTVSNQVDVQRTVRLAIESDGELRGAISEESLSINRFFVHYHNELNFFKQPEVQDVIGRVKYDSDLQQNPAVRAHLERFKNLLAIKQYFLSLFDYPSAPFQDVSDLEMLQLIKNL